MKLSGSAVALNVALVLAGSMRNVPLIGMPTAAPTRVTSWGVAPTPYIVILAGSNALLKLTVKPVGVGDSDVTKRPRVTTGALVPPIIGTVETVSVAAIV